MTAVDVISFLPKSGLKRTFEIRRVQERNAKRPRNVVAIPTPPVFWAKRVHKSLKTKGERCGNVQTVQKLMIIRKMYLAEVEKTENSGKIDWKTPRRRGAASSDRLLWS